MLDICKMLITLFVYSCHIQRQIFNPIPDRKFSSHGNAIFPMFSADGDAAAGRCISAIAPTPNCTGTGTGTGAAALFFLDDVGSLGPSVSVVATSPHNDNGIPGMGIACNLLYSPNNRDTSYMLCRRLLSDFGFD